MNEDLKQKFKDKLDTSETSTKFWTAVGLRRQIISDIVTLELDRKLGKDTAKELSELEKKKVSVNEIVFSLLSLYPSAQAEDLLSKLDLSNTL